MKSYQGEINVMLKKSVLDPQGQVILEALHALGFQEAEGLRTGKHFRVAIKAESESQARARLAVMCNQLLVNPVIEEYVIEIDGAG